MSIRASAPTTGPAPPAALTFVPATTVTSFALTTQLGSNGMPLNTWTLEALGTSVIATALPLPPAELIRDPLDPSTDTLPSSSGNVNSSTDALLSSGGNVNPSTIQSTTSFQTPTSSNVPGISLGAGAGAGIGIAALIFLLAVAGGIVYYLRRRRRRIRARAAVEVLGHEPKPQLDDTSIEPLNRRFETIKTVLGDRQELEGSSPQYTPTRNPAELKAGPYSNRHELNGHRQ